MAMLTPLFLLAILATAVHGAGYRTVGSSGVAAQMVFLNPYTNNVVFLDNYHDNRGGPGYNVAKNTYGPSWLYPGTKIPVFSTEYNLDSNTIRALRPGSNTFCSAGAFTKDGQIINMAGAEPYWVVTGVPQGFDKIRTLARGPCAATGCKQDWVEQKQLLQTYRWYPTAQTMTNGDIVVVGGSNAGLLVLNEASINVPTYEKLAINGGALAKPVILPILQFTAAENLVANKSYNLYPIIHALPNRAVTDQMLVIAGNRVVIWDFTNDKLIATLPNTPLQPRTFPSSATSVLLPLEYPKFDPTVLLCGGSSADMPNPQALADCYTMAPLTSPVWKATDSMPNGPQTMSDGILLPDGTVLIINGARKGSAGGLMADEPVLVPLIYNPKAAAGKKFTSQPATKIPRLYHSVAILLPSGEVLIAGSNPNVFWDPVGSVVAANRAYPKFQNNGHIAALNQQQAVASRYATEYRVEIFSPAYMDSPTRPALTGVPAAVKFGAFFRITARVGAAAVTGNVKVVMVSTGFGTHGVAMGQRMVVMAAYAGSGATWNVLAPRDASVIPPGVYLLFIVKDGVPSVGKWTKIGA